MTAVLALLAASCEVPEVYALEISLRSTEMDHKGGTQFVSVNTEAAWTLSLVSDAGDVDWATLSVTSGKGVKNDIQLKVSENTTGSRRELRIVADNGSEWKSVTLVQTASDERPEEEPDIEDGEVNRPSSVKKWMELPEISSEEAGAYYAHHFTMNEKSYRNYSFIWSKEDLVAPWVAYPLCSMYSNKSVSRTDDWQYDPDVPESWQPYMFKGVTGYDRGHQLPSADRLCCYEANAQTFYFTNMTPQLGTLNQRVWADLENQVRTWSNSLDTLYVVTGCIPEGSSLKATDREGNKITVPVGYYKALLGYKKTATIGTSTAGYVGVAFYFDHKAYSSYSTQKMTIRQLEDKTGLNFFVNLPNKIGETISGQVEENIDSWWGL